MSAVSTKPNSRAAAPAQECSAPVGLDLDSVRPQLDAAWGMVCVLSFAFCGEPDFKRSKQHVRGLMGVMQLADRALSDLHSEITTTDAVDMPEAFFWGVFGAKSLLAFLTEFEVAEGWEWSVSDEILLNYLSAARECLDQAREALKSLELGHG
jgi:hypothetical protein